MIIYNLLFVGGGGLHFGVSRPIKTHPSPYQPSLSLLMVALAEGWMQVSVVWSVSYIMTSARVCVYTIP